MDKKTFYLDLLERVGWTFVQGFAAFWIVTGAVDADTLVGGLVAGGLAVAKALLAIKIGPDDDSAALPLRLPQGRSTPTPAEEWMHEVTGTDRQP